ncbi:hypothetical protein [Pedococcus sp. 5OH_020]|uniref:hypothetical protein n=1 Tax=Pedococcus sp. 5OH_020 TaxID=2989814 RepID=UPI0022E9BAE6|nr:hypothetical protein [Pedococcus sp. 5OH_020]
MNIQEQPQVQAEKAVGPAVGTGVDDATMSAIVQAGYGEADVLQLDRVPAPRSRRMRSLSRCGPRAWTAARGT